jgi:hypothetical protein
MLDAIVAHYERQLRLHGPTARGVDWKDAASQSLRFSVLCGICDLNGRSIHEVGAGAGHLVDFLDREGIEADYSGSDRSAAMVKAAQRRHPGVAFERSDSLEDAPEAAWDVVVCSGLFHVSLGHSEHDWWSFVSATLRRMFAMSRLGIAFNLMSDRVDHRSPDLFYADAGRTLDFCRDALSRRVVLRHDYPLHEYTVYVYHADAVVG